jgi:hypothetical protein
MTAALPPDLFKPLFAEIEEKTESEDIHFATNTAFLFKSWQSMLPSGPATNCRS